MSGLWCSWEANQVWVSFNRGWIEYDVWVYIDEWLENVHEFLMED